MARCKVCNKDSALISSFLGLCLDCIRGNFNSSLPYIQKAHCQARKHFNLPTAVPADTGGVRCKLCINACQVRPGGVGFCGLPLDSREEVSLEWYYDRLPTNCVADWVCDGSADVGYKNLAVFYNACSFNCLFCQNWHFRESNLRKKISAQELARQVDERTSCICYFGGDPTPQFPHAILASRIACELNKGRVLRICWETNGSMSSKYLKEMLEIFINTGGCIKFDLKAWSEELNIALCGVSNKQTLENFKFVASFMDKRPKPPLVIASTLLIPGYVDIHEIENIANFMASINHAIPYALLAFHPQFYMDDLPPTSRQHAQKAKEAALKAGLENVRIGNIHLLSDTYTQEV